MKSGISVASERRGGLCAGRRVPDVRYCRRVRERRPLRVQRRKGFHGPRRPAVLGRLGARVRGVQPPRGHRRQLPARARARQVLVGLRGRQDLDLRARAGGQVPRRQRLRFGRRRLHLPAPARPGGGFRRRSHSGLPEAGRHPGGGCAHRAVRDRRPDRGHADPALAQVQPHRVGGRGDRGPQAERHGYRTLHAGRVHPGRRGAGAAAQSELLARRTAQGRVPSGHGHHGGGLPARRAQVRRGGPADERRPRDPVRAPGGTRTSLCSRPGPPPRSPSPCRPTRSLSTTTGCGKR